MARLRPIHAILLVVVFMALVVSAQYAWEGGFGHGGYDLVRPDAEGRVTVDIADLEPQDVRFYRFLNAGNQEVKFLVGRDRRGTVQVGFDASESHSLLGRGFSAQDGWIVDNKCESAVRLETVNEGGRGCRPVPLDHRVEGDRVILAEQDILRGWRYFR